MRVIFVVTTCADFFRHRKPNNTKKVILCKRKEGEGEGFRKRKKERERESNNNYTPLLPKENLILISKWSQ